jgi:hypothetical protein
MHAIAIRHPSRKVGVKFSQHDCLIYLHTTLHRNAAFGSTSRYRITTKSAEKKHAEKLASKNEKDDTSCREHGRQHTDEVTVSFSTTKKRIEQRNAAEQIRLTALTLSSDGSSASGRIGRLTHFPSKLQPFSNVPVCKVALPTIVVACSHNTLYDRSGFLTSFRQTFSEKIVHSRHDTIWHGQRARCLNSQAQILCTPGTHSWRLMRY